MKLKMISEPFTAIYVIATDTTNTEVRSPFLTVSHGPAVESRLRWAQIDGCYGDCAFRNVGIFSIVTCDRAAVALK